VLLLQLELLQLAAGLHLQGIAAVSRSSRSCLAPDVGAAVRILRSPERTHVK
jgi:hypothetical protein